MRRRPGLKSGDPQNMRLLCQEMKILVRQLFCPKNHSYPRPIFIY